MQFYQRAHDHSSMEKSFTSMYTTFLSECDVHWQKLNYCEHLWTLWHLPAPRMNFDEIGVTINLLAKFWWRCLDGKPEREIRTTSRTPQHRNWCITRSCSKMLGSCSLLGFMHLIKWGAVLSSLCINLFNWPCTSPEIKTTVVNIQLSLQNEFSKCQDFWWVEK